MNDARGEHLYTQYLNASGCQDDIRYRWYDRRSITELEPDADLFARLSFATGSAEWLVYRLDRLCDTSAAWDLIEMAWASIVQYRYSIGPKCWCTQWSWIHGRGLFRARSGKVS